MLLQSGCRKSDSKAVIHFRLRFFLELFHLNEVVVYAVLFARAGGASGVGNRQLHLARSVMLGQQGIEQTGLTGPARGRDDIESALLRHVCTFKR